MNRSRQVLRFGDNALMATKTRKRGKAPKKYKTPLYERIRRQAIKPTALWAKLTEAARRKLTTAGYDQQSWDNNCREIVTVSEYDLLQFPSNVVSISVAKFAGRKGRKFIEDEDAFKNSILSR